MEEDVWLFTDGSCDPNPGPGGWAALLRAGDKEKLFVGAFRKTTNNRMELQAVIGGLKALKRPGTTVKVVSDSQYVTEAVTQGWLAKWATKEFRKGDGFRENTDLWIELQRLLLVHRVTFEWTRGHAGHAENERCDGAAAHARANGELLVDLGFEDPAAARVALGWGLL